MIAPGWITLLRENTQSVAQLRRMLITDCAAMQTPYFAAAMEPALVEPGLVAAQCRLRSSWESLTVAAASPAERQELAWAQALLPTSMGGCGVHDTLAWPHSAVSLRSILHRWMPRTFWQSPLRSNHKQWASTLGETVTSRAQELGVAPEVLYAGRDIERLIQATLDQQPIPKDLLGWRDSVITQHLVDLLAPLVRVPDEIQSTNELPRG